MRMLTARTLRRLVLLGAAIAVLAAAVAVAAPGDLDPGFDGDGRKTIDYGGGDAAQDVLVQPDGKIVIAGYGNPATDVAVSRLNADGSLDPSFDGDGLVGVNLGAADFGLGAALQADGKIVVAGYTTATGALDVALVRLNADGSPDPSFDGDGKRTIDYGGSDAAQDVLVQPDGKIVIAGHGNPATDFAVSRLNPDGSLDPSFDGDGTISVNFGGRDYGSGAALQADGKIVVAGYTSFTGGRDVALLRLNADGSPDLSFDGDGKRTIDYGGSDAAQDVLVQPDGKIVIAGYGNPARDFAVSRLNPDGSLDPSFDGDGTIGVNFGTNDEGMAAALQANGKIVVAGYAGGDSDSALVRLQPGGSLDTSFNFDGKQTLGSPGLGTSNGLTLQADGKIVTAGYTEENAYDFLVARLEGDPVAVGGGPPDGGDPGGPGAVPRCRGKRATIVGSSGRDRLRGTRRSDVIVALGGNDLVKGGRGNDLICAGNGNDKVAGAAGKDRLYGQTGRDKLSGGSGNDTINGGSGKDRLNGNAGRDRCNGGTGADRATCERERQA